MTAAERRISARVILIDERGRLVLLRRTRPGAAPYLTTAGGGVEPSETLEGAAERECLEELGAAVLLGRRVPIPVADGGGSEQRFLLGRLIALDPTARSGPEFEEPWRGTYETVALPLGDPALSSLRPAELREHLARHGAALVAEALGLSRPGAPARD